MDRQSLPDTLSAKLMCREATKAMVEEFPELSRIRGHYKCSVDLGSHPHWWCVTADGEIVDPTAHQFSSKGDGQYEPRDESEPEPVGRCYNCGDVYYDPSFGGTCSEDCYAAYRSFVMYC